MSVGTPASGGSAATSVSAPLSTRTLHFISAPQRLITPGVQSVFYSDPTYVTFAGKGPGFNRGRGRLVSGALSSPVHRSLFSR